MYNTLKAVFITLPQRGNPSFFPPLGPLAVMNALKKHGYENIHFYNIDVLRPSREEAIEHIVSLRPDVVAISAPVSTAYDNCRFFSKELKKVLPNIKIILGGNMTASAEIIFRGTDVDYCIIGEGEKVIGELFDCMQSNNDPADLSKIKGLAYMLDGRFACTGYTDQIPQHQIFDVDWDMLDELSVKHYFTPLNELDPLSVRYKYFFYDDIYALQSKGTEYAKKTIAIMSCSKGCIGRCTYCHRFTKGIRVVPVDIVMMRIKELIHRFNIGAIEFSDECFGVNKQWLADFCKAIGGLDIVWRVGGMRVDAVTPEIIKMMKNAGCRTIVYGVESGSERILKIMEKKVSIQQNINAIQWTVEAGLYTIPQLVIGMPGETTETIKETANFTANAITISNRQNPGEVGMTFAQALPGTPLYEYARSVGIIGATPEAEEEYLIRISDKDAADRHSTLNFTKYPRLIMLSWPLLIHIIVSYRYVSIFGKIHFHKILSAGHESGYGSLAYALRSGRYRSFLSAHPGVLYRLRWFVWIVPFLNTLKLDGFTKTWRLLLELIGWHIQCVTGKNHSFPFLYKSLRKILADDMDNAYSGSKEMEILRRGR